MALPAVEFNEKRDPENYHAKVPYRYEAFLERMRELLVGDCFAVTVNDEVVYNRIAQKPIRERILDTVVRDAFMANPHAIFGPVLDKYQNSIIKLYMYSDAPWFVYIVYNPDTEVFRVSYYKSAQYMNRYE
jgi:hypothetical protein